MKSFVISGIILLILYQLAIKNLPFQERMISYGEARYALDFPQREIELVAIGQRFESGKCKRDSIINKLYTICENTPHCTQTKYECKSEMEPRYQRMFNQETEASTHYVHMRDLNDKLEGIILLWGLTQQESFGFCQSLVSDFLSKQGDDVSMRCI